VITATAWRTGMASDAGLRRATNEDRVWADEGRGVFLVVDGLGGHAAGEMAAETAVDTIATVFHEWDGADVEGTIQSAIASANNRIFELAGENKDWEGMACVLTLAVVQEDRVVIGHVGDSRMYLVWNGHLRKLTSDHSPVGELEDAAELSERQAMDHPRRNEVFRDVGSRLREGNEEDFIEIKNCLFRPDAALLLCSDGLTDVLTVAQIRDVIEQYNGDANRTARDLIAAANAGGGKDNISVIFVAGGDFIGSESKELTEARPRHAITRMRGGQRSWRTVLNNAIWLVLGMVVGMVLWAALERTMPRTPTQAPVAKETATLRAPADIQVNAADSQGINNALASTVPGDVVHVPGGQYLGPIHLKDGVSIVSNAPGEAVIRSDASSANDPGLAIVARKIQRASVRGLRIVGDETHPLRTGIMVSDSSLEIADVEISGAIESGVRFEGASQGELLAGFIHGNAGSGVQVKDASVVRLAANRILENGRTAGALRAGVEVDNGAKVSFGENVILRNGRAH
jgi:serine/threonine protein phosphatase PrpC